MHGTFYSLEAEYCFFRQLFSFYVLIMISFHSTFHALCMTYICTDIVLVAALVVGAISEAVAASQGVVVVGPAIVTPLCV